MPRRRKRKPNAGSFRKGPDARRHRFTDDERRRGYDAAMHHPDIHVVAWVFRRVRGHYRARRRASAAA